MAEVSKGTAHLYGINGTSTIGTVVSVTVKESFANVAEVNDEEGNVIHKRYDDRRKELSLEVIPQSGAAPEVGGSVTWDGVSYIIESVDDKREAKGFVRYTITGVNYELIA